MASKTPNSLRTSSRPVYSCIRCSDRKVKCNRQNPCSACVKHNVDCVYNHNPSHPARKKHKRAQDSALVDRLKQYELLFQELGIDPDLRGKSTVAVKAVPVPEAPQLQIASSPSIQSESGQCVNKTKIVHDQGRSKLVEKSVTLNSVKSLR